MKKFVLFHLKTNNILILVFLVSRSAIVYPISVTKDAPASGTVSSAGTCLGTGDINWGTASNVLTSNNAYAASNYPGGFGLRTSNCLRVSGFGFSLIGVTILGITVEIEHSKTNVGASWCEVIELMKAGSGAATAKSDCTIPSSDTYETYGSASDFWGTTWTEADINNAGFGVQINVDEDALPASTLRIDHVKITVEYNVSESVELISFQPTKQTNKLVMLEWQTASESENNFFSIERSKDGSRYENLGIIPAQKEQPGIRTYVFADNNPLSGTFYYGLSQTDINGNTKSLKTIEVTFAGYSSVLLEEIYPNPVREEFNVAFFVSNPATVSLLLYNCAGQEVLFKHWEDYYSGGSYMESVQVLGGLEAGTYAAKISFKDLSTGARQTINKKIIIVK